MGKSDVPALSPADLTRALRKGHAAPLGTYQIVRTHVLGKTVFFAVRHARDVIQRHHVAGRFYEPEELEIIRGAFRPGGTFLDIGANVGNHALYAALFLHPARVIVVEPNPLAYNNLIANLALNRVEHLFDLTWLGHGLGAEEASGFTVVAGGRNLGGGQLVRPEDGAAEGTIPITTGDRVVGSTRVDFIKIDVEGMEIAALSGLSATIARDRPPIFVEVDNDNRAAFLEWVEGAGYRIETTFRRYAANENFLLLPKAEAPETEQTDA